MSKSKYKHKCKITTNVNIDLHAEFNTGARKSTSFIGLTLTQFYELCPLW